MKKVITWILVLILLAGCGSGAASSSEDLSKYTAELTEGGVTFVLPAGLRETKGALQTGYGAEIQDSGVYLSALTYAAMPQEKFHELASRTNFTNEEIEYIGARLFDFLLVYGIDGNRKEAELKAFAEGMGIPVEGARLVGTSGEYTFYAVIDPFKAEQNESIVFDEGFLEDYHQVLKACDDLSWINVYKPHSSSVAGEGGLVEFETRDLDGNTVRSKDIFSKHTLTMVNIWGTYCSPCLSEMPDLEVLNQRLSDKNCAIIGVVCDIASASDADMIATAKKLVEMTGVTYINLIPWKGVDQVIPSAFVPTTYFIDSEGNIFGEALVGARGADEYEAYLDELLAKLK